ncbi:MAG: hypothetical protein DDT40_01753 [candidate division WS2 bacterium]|nr:hypothetical protein [Candidatus Psychracetigena formicireducens]
MNRPDILEGKTVKVMTGCGDLYVTINTNGNENKPWEIMSHSMESVGCSKCQNEALTRVVSLGLKWGVPVEKVVKELEGLRCPSPRMYPKKERVLSCADAIAKVLRGWCNATDVSQG